jgi:hypothetical protein
MHMAALIRRLLNEDYLIINSYVYSSIMTLPLKILVMKNSSYKLLNTERTIVLIILLVIAIMSGFSFAFSH